jgi:hypothetical protein
VAKDTTATTTGIDGIAAGSPGATAQSDPGPQQPPAPVAEGTKPPSNPVRKTTSTGFSRVAATPETSTTPNGTAK